MKDWRVHQGLSRWPRFFGLTEREQSDLVERVQSLIAEAKAESKRENSLLGEISKQITAEESRG